MSYRWKEQTVPMVSLYCLNTAIKKIGRWQRTPQELAAHNESLEKLESATSSAERVAAMNQIVGSLRQRAQSGRLPQSLSIEVDGHPLDLTLSSGRYTISGYDSEPKRQAAQSALRRLSEAYADAVTELSDQLCRAESRLAGAQTDAASLREFELDRKRLQAEKEALEVAENSLKKTRVEEITAKAKALGYSIREVKVGNTVQLNLVRRV